MCNCGSKRDDLIKNESFTLSNVNSIKKAETKMWPDMAFEYTGKTALTVIGSVTGSRYRFHQPGDVQLIDYRDASGMINVPVLKKTHQ
jgi:hypothetical protein